MTKRAGFDVTVTLIRGPGFPPEKMSLAEAVQAVMDSPVREKLKDATILCEDMLIEGLEKIGAIAALPDFPRIVAAPSESE